MQPLTRDENGEKPPSAPQLLLKQGKEALSVSSWSIQASSYRLLSKTSDMTAPNLKRELKCNLLCIQEKISDQYW